MRYSSVRVAETVTVASGTDDVPFACTTPSVFVAEGQNTTRLWHQYQEPTSSRFIQIGTAADWQYNAIAYRPSDGFIYGISSAVSPNRPANPVGHLVRLDATGRFTDLGAVAGWTFEAGAVGADTAKTNWLKDITSGINAGAFHPTDDTYWVSNASSGTRVVYQLDLNSRTVRQISTSEFRTNDFTYKDGYLWGIRNPVGGDTGSRTMLRMTVDTTRGTVGVVDSFSTDIPVSALPDDIYGAAWTYGNGNLGFDRNSYPATENGRFFQIQVTGSTTANPKFSLVYSGPAPGSYNNDGTSCTSADESTVNLGIEKIGPATVAPGGTISWTLRITNHGPGVSSGGFLDDDVPVGYTNVTVGSAFGNVCTTIGNRLQCSTGIMNPGDTYDIPVTATAPALTTGETARTLTNTVAITGNEADPGSENDTSSSTTRVTAARIDVTKDRDLPDDAARRGR